MNAQNKASDLQLCRAAYRNRTDDLRITRGKIRSRASASCSDSTGLRIDGTRGAGTIRRPGPQTGPRWRSLRPFILLLCVMSLRACIRAREPAVKGLTVFRPLSHVAWPAGYAAGFWTSPVIRRLRQPCHGGPCSIGANDYRDGSVLYGLGAPRWTLDRLPEHARDRWRPSRPHRRGVSSPSAPRRLEPCLRLAAQPAQTVVTGSSCGPWAVAWQA